MTEFDYTLTHDPGGTPVDITLFVERIEWTETGTGIVNSLKVRLNAQDGQFITRDTQLGTGDATPILDEFQRLRLAVIDRDSNIYANVFEIDNLKPVQNAQQGTIIEVECLGLEHHLQRTQFTKQFFFESAFGVARGIIDFYNASSTKGTAQPIITENDNVEFNTLPLWTANDYLFNISETKCYDGITNVVDRIGSSVASGGAGDFWEFQFLTDVSDATFNSITFNATISGNPPSQQTNGVFDPSKAVIIDDSVAVNPGEEEGGIESTRGTVTATWGSDGVGSLPTQSADFVGGLEAWQLFPAHQPGVEYPQDAIVLIPDTVDSQGDNNHFKALTITTDTPPSGDWVQYFFTDFLTNEISISGQYSLWTNAKANEWKSSCANPDGPQNQDDPTFDGRACWDSNLVLVDGDVFRSWADVRAVDVGTIATQYKRNGLFYRGFRILIDTIFGTPTGELAGFVQGQIVAASSNDGVNNVWRVVRSLQEGGQCGVDNEGRVFQLQSGILQDISGSVSQANDCYHNVWAIFNSQGFNNKNNGAGGNFGEFSAVTHEFRMASFDANQGVTDEPKYYRVFAGFNFRIPYPHDSFNGNTIGELYGDNDKLDPATLDANNMHLTHDGQNGFNNTSAEDLGPLDAVTFALKMEWRYEIDGSGGLVPRGNLPYRCVMYDTSDNVVVADFTVSFNNLWQSFSLPFSSFKIYRARAGWSAGSVGQNTFLQDLEILNVFEFKNIVKIGIHWLGPYDDQGRFTPFFRRSDIFWQITDFVNSPEGITVSEYNIKLAVDNFGFSKPLLSVSPPDTTRSLQPEFFQEPLISNKYQNDQANLASLEIMQFRHQQFDTVTEGLFDINFGDTFYLRNEELVNASDNGDNTIKLVAKNITYTIDKTPQGPGGFLRTITGVKRFS